ncbi:MAG TPA: TIGR02594 family protein [Stellaceae bacterium]|nr:TIGR02594 family protein [Stellaceae bacterium]
MVTRIFTDVEAADRDDVIFLIQADGGTFTSQTVDGKETITAQFDQDVPEELPGAAPGVPWMTIARGELGVTEGNNPRITEYFATTALGPQPDSVPWCAAFVNFCVTRSGNTGTNSALARSWLEWGSDSDFVPGCVVVLARGGPQTGHVGFYVGRDQNGAIQLLGGNQHNSVNISTFANATILGARMLQPADVQQQAPLPPVAALPPPAAGLDGKALLKKAMTDQGVLDNTLRAGVAAIVAVESDFEPRSEMSYRHTSPERLRLLFGSRVGDLDDTQLAQLATDDRAFFDRIYGGNFGRIQLGNIQPDDGFNFRGRGLLQLTGRSNYARYGGMISVNLIGDPDLANDPPTSAQIAVAYIRDRFRGGDFNAMKRAVGNSSPDINQRKDQQFAEFLENHEFDA